MTVVHTLADANFGGNKLPVLCADGAGVCNIGTDLIFDAKNPACYAAGVLPADGAAVPIAGLLNLARNTAPAITGAGIPRGNVTAAELSNAGSVSPVFSGGGWRIGGSGSAKRPLAIKKAGIADNRVNEAVLEGFRSFLALVWFRIISASTNYGLGLMSVGRSNVAGSWFIGTQGTSLNVVAAGVAAGTASLNTLAQTGVVMRYDTVAQTVTPRPVWNGQLGAAGSAASVSSAVGNDTNSRACIGHFPGFSIDSSEIVIYRAVREYIDVTGLSDADIAAYVARDYAYGVPRFS